MGYRSSPHTGSGNSIGTFVEIPHFPVYHARILASPFFFYTVSSHTKMLMDRCQSFWVKQYLMGRPIAPGRPRRKGAFIAVGATRGKRLFDGVVLTARYFFDALEFDLSETLLVRGVDEKGEIFDHPEEIQAAYELGRRLAANPDRDIAP